MFKLFFKFRYPKLFLLIALIIVAYFIFDNPRASILMERLGDFQYIGIFIAGLLFSFGFTTPFAVGFFLSSEPSNILVAGVIGGCGALIADLLIFRFVRFSFQDEFNRLRKNPALVKGNRLMERTLGRKLMVYFMYAFAGFIIASPLPDEAGITMLAGLTKIKESVLALISFVFNTLGIIILLSIA